MSLNYFESDEALESYLFCHYGMPEESCFSSTKTRAVLAFADDFVLEPMRHVSLKNQRRALDLGCATGRGTFELRQFFDEAVGIDLSASFISAAQKMQQQGYITTKKRAGDNGGLLYLKLPPHLKTKGIQFKQGDACALDADLGRFDLVILTQLIDRLPDPALCLRQMANLIEREGWLVITTACNWQEKFTPRDKWLADGRSGVVTGCSDILLPFFDLRHHYHMQYFIREQPHWYEWSVAEVSIWQRNLIPTPSTPNVPPQVP